MRLWRMTEKNFRKKEVKDFIPSIFWLWHRMSINILWKHNTHRVEKMFGNIGIWVSSCIICKLFIHSLCLTANNITHRFVQTIGTCHEASCRCKAK